MASHGIVFLMYHELELPGRAMVRSEPGYVRYILTEAGFRSQIDWLRNNGWKGVSVGEALRSPAEKSVAITFDDGCETDLISAAPILRKAGFRATFYVTVGFLNKPGFMTTAQLRELNSAGFEIGCHSMTHAYLNDLDSEHLHVEIVDSRTMLEDMIGQKVETFSIPGGPYNERALAVLKQAGYSSVATSRPYANLPSTDRFQLGRVAILRHTGQGEFQGICTGENLWKIRLNESIRTAVRKTFGNTVYDRVRRVLLSRG
jgi:peptidoglycan/xylan/chitin deacetylase (PgdA/CDA1 family)